MPRAAKVVPQPKAAPAEPVSVVDVRNGMLARLNRQFDEMAEERQMIERVQNREQTAGVMRKSIAAADAAATRKAALAATQRKLKKFNSLITVRLVLHAGQGAEFSFECAHTPASRGRPRRPAVQRRPIDRLVL